VEYSLHAPCQAKVAYLNGAVIIYEDISWLQVSMHYLGFMEVIKPAEDVVNDGFDLDFLQVLRRFQQFLQVHVTRL